MFIRGILLALIVATPCIGHASFIVSEDDGSSTSSSFTGTTSQGGTLVPHLPGATQIIMQIGSSDGQAALPPIMMPDPAQLIANWQVITIPQPDVLPISQGANAAIRIGGVAPSVIYPAIRVTPPPLLQISPVDFQLVLAPSALPESGTALMWAMGAIGILLASKRKSISRPS